MSSADSLSDGYISDSASSLGTDAESEEKDVSTDADVIEFAKYSILTLPVPSLNSLPRAFPIPARFPSLSLPLSLSVSLSPFPLGLVHQESPARPRAGTLAWIQWPTVICFGLRSKH